MDRRSMATETGNTVLPREGCLASRHLSSGLFGHPPLLEWYVVIG